MKRMVAIRRVQRHPESLLPFLLVILFASCSSDSSPVTPLDTGPEARVVVTATIGTEGGVLGTDTVGIIIPPGVLSTAQELSLLQRTDLPLGTQQASPTFELTGIPADASGSVTFRARTNVAPKGLSYVHTAEEAVLHGYEKAKTVTSYHAARESSGFLIAEIPLTPRTTALAKGSGGYGKVVFTSTKWATAVSSGNRFTSVFSIDDITAAQVLQVLEYFEAAYQKGAAIGFSYSGKNWSQPIPVALRPFADSWITGESAAADGYYTRAFPYLSSNDGMFELNSKRLLGSVPIAKGIVMHEFMHFIQDCHANANSAQNLWLMEAMACWAEELLQDQPSSYVPDPAFQEYIRPFLGIQAGAEWIDPENPDVTARGRSQFHGYGMASLIKYMVQRTPGITKEAAIKNMMAEVAKGSHPVTAVLSSVPGQDGRALWRSYFTALIGGTIYPFPASAFKKDAAIFSSSQDFRIASSAVTGKSFTFSLPDLSAKCFRVFLERPFEQDEVLKITGTYAAAGFDGTVKVFKYLSTPSYPVEIASFSGATPMFTLTDLPALESSGYDLLVVFLNHHLEPPYLTAENVDLSFTLERQAMDTLQTFLAACKQVQVSLSGTIALTNGETSYGVTVYNGMLAKKIDAMTWNGNSFTMQWSVPMSVLGYSNSGTYSGSISGTLSQDRKSLQSVTASEEWSFLDISGNGDRTVRTASLSFSSLPLTRMYDGGTSYTVTYSVKGSDGETHVSTAAYRQRITDKDGAVESDKSIQSINWNSVSDPPVISVSFTDRDWR